MDGDFDVPKDVSSQATHQLYADRLNELDDNRIRSIRPLIPPQILMEDLPVTAEAAKTVLLARQEATNIVQLKDDRLLVIVGPCSIHDVKAAQEYATLLKAYAAGARDDLSIIMRVYFEKPRTTVGWKGLINDPHLDGTFAVNKGLKIARQLLLQLNERGIPAAVEFLDTISPQYIGDLVSWGAIGARTTESQVHRELASGLSVPVGFKNGTDGSVTIAMDAIRAASAGHCFLSVTKQGLSAIVETTGNDSCHVILRGGASGPNYAPEHVAKCSKAMEGAKITPSIMIDCSHGNSQKDHKKQIDVAKSVAEQLSDPTSETAKYITGVMIESHLLEGRQNLTGKGLDGLTYGQSITDACVSWQDTVVILDMLRNAVRARRANKQK